MRFNCSYAYDISCYADFTVEAKDADEANAIIQNALEDGRFSSVAGEPSWDDTSNDRVFVSGPSSEQNIGDYDDIEKLDNIEPPCTSQPTPTLTTPQPQQP